MRYICLRDISSIFLCFENEIIFLDSLSDRGFLLHLYILVADKLVSVELEVPVHQGSQYKATCTFP